MTSLTYALHGIVLRSSVPLDEPAVRSQAPDVVVEMGTTRDVGEEVPNGEIMAELWMGDRRGYTVVDTGHEIVVRFPALADFLIDPHSRRIVCHVATCADPAIASILLPGTVLGVYLAMSGHCVLHASAVEVNGLAIVFAGPTGTGKSTCGAMACAGGANLITDDALVIDLAESAHAVPGTSHLRLRGPASAILDSLPGSPRSWDTADKRLAVVPVTHREATPIAGVVIPKPDRENDRLQVTRVRPTLALPLLLAFARVPGWRVQDVVRSQFLNMATLANRVPVYEASIPWGPPFDIEPVKDLIEEVSTRGPF